jgi:hypothetical protein
MRHVGIHQPLVNAADGGLVGNLGQGVGDTDNGDCPGDCLVFDDLQAIHMSASAKGLTLGNAGYLGRCLMFKGDPGFYQSTGIFSREGDGFPYVYSVVAVTEPSCVEFRHRVFHCFDCVIYIQLANPTGREGEIRKVSDVSTDHDPGLGHYLKITMTFPLIAGI